MQRSSANKSRLRIIITRTLMLACAVIVVTLVYLWLTLLSPFGYSAPDHTPALGEDETHEVFVHGTLRYPVVRWLVTGTAGESTPATLPGYRREALNVVPEPGASVEGEVIEVDTRALQRLDRYERLGIRYERVMLTLEDGSRAWVYRLLEPLPL